MKASILLIPIAVILHSAGAQTPASAPSPARVETGTVARSDPANQHLTRLELETQALKKAIEALRARKDSPSHILALDQLLRSKETILNAAKLVPPVIDETAPLSKPINQIPSNPDAPEVTVGNELIPRTLRDGADQITFIDITQVMPSDGKIVSWSFYAQKHSEEKSNSDPRNLKLQIFRRVEQGYQLIDQSPYFTVEADGWDTPHHLALEQPIYVEKGDLIGWYYPTQGIPGKNGGVIAFQTDKTNRTIYRWNQSRGDPLAAPATNGNMIESREFTTSDNGRMYSIQVNLVKKASYQSGHEPPKNLQQ